jgi:hypothetical protein
VPHLHHRPGTQCHPGAMQREVARVVTYCELCLLSPLTVHTPLTQASLLIQSRVQRRLLDLQRLAGFARGESRSCLCCITCLLHFPTPAARHGMQAAIAAERHCPDIELEAAVPGCTLP